MFAGVSATEGAYISYLAKAKSGCWPYIDQLAGKRDPPFPGDPAAFIAKHQTEGVDVKRFLTNKVKKCEGCGKPNAFTLEVCNSCGVSLVSTPIGSSNNVFMGFVLGIEKGPFPFTVSIRHQTPQVLVVDDLLALSPMHFNVIQTTAYLPDWRYLLRRPAEGAALVKTMLDGCAEAAQPFLQNDAWRKKVFAAEVADQPIPLQDIVAAGFNYPPSQYQLHIQYMLPILTPFHYANFLKGVHYTYKRFFPVQYVANCLKLLVEGSEPMPSELLQEETPIEDIIDYFDKKYHYSYEKVWNDKKAIFKVNAAKYAGWHASDFEGLVVEMKGKARYLEGESLAEVSGTDISALNNEDKAVLQNYGRPYTAEGKPIGSYYSFPKDPKDIASW